jgi:two-component system sensor histidine kinase DctS
LPWWFAQANEVSLLEPNTAKLLAKTAKGGPGYGVYTHEMSLDVGSLSMMFFVNARKEAPRVFSNRMAALVSVLAVLLSLSLFFLWRDFRRRLHVEAKLREETAFRESMQDSMAVGLRVWDMDGCIRYVNPAFCRMVGLESSELVGKRPPLPYWLPSETDEYKRLVALVFAGQAPRKGFETTFKHKDGHAIDVLIVEAPLLDAKGQQNGWMSSILDITDRKKSEALIRSQEEKLQTTSRLALIGEMASNIAHELNQPLATMVSYAQTGLNLAEKPQPYMPDLRALFERLRDQSQRAGKVIKSVQSLVKERQLRREEVEVHAMLNALQPTFDALAKPSFATVQFNTEPDQLYITVDRIMLEQAIINLVKNALETSNDAGGQRWVSILAKLNDEQCEVIVEDNGPGVGEKDIETLFKPMFSTKRDGLGLGLNLCRSVAEVHGGKLTPALRPEGGMRFTLSFPAKGL